MISKVDKLVKSTIQLSAELGISGASTAKIAKHADVATGTLFHHFPTKEKLISASYLAALKDYAWNVVGIFDYPKDQLEKRLTKFIKASIDYWSRNRASLIFVTQVYTSSINNTQLKMKAEQQHHHIMTALSQGIQEGLLTKSYTSVIYHLMLGSILQTAVLIINEADPKLQRKMRKAGITFIWQALKAVK